MRTTIRFPCSFRLTYWTDIWIHTGSPDVWQNLQEHPPQGIQQNPHCLHHALHFLLHSSYSFIVGQAGLEPAQFGFIRTVPLPTWPLSLGGLLTLTPTASPCAWYPLGLATYPDSYDDKHLSPVNRPSRLTGGVDAGHFPSGSCKLLCRSHHHNDTFPNCAQTVETREGEIVDCHRT